MYVPWEEKNSTHQLTILITMYIHYDPLVMSKKEAPRKHPLVLTRKVAYLV